jgi:hypothetical protein
LCCVGKARLLAGFFFFSGVLLTLLNGGARKTGFVLGKTAFHAKVDMDFIVNAPLVSFGGTAFSQYFQ